MDFHKIKLKNSCVKNFLEYRIEISDKNRNRYWKTFFIACPMPVNISLKQRVEKVKEKQLLGNEQLWV